MQVSSEKLKEYMKHLQSVDVLSSLLQEAPMQSAVSEIEREERSHRHKLVSRGGAAAPPHPLAWDPKGLDWAQTVGIDSSQP